MLKTTTKALLGRGGRNRISRGALFVSVGLHLLLIAAILLIRPWEDASTPDSPGIFVVDLVLVGDGQADGGRIPEAEAVADRPEPTRDRVSEADARIPSAAAVSEPSQLSEPASAGVARNDTGSRPTDAPSAAGPLGGIVDEPLRAGTAPAPDPVAMAAVPLPDFAAFREPETAALAADERRLLDEKLPQWWANLDGVAAGEPLVFDHEGRSYSAEFSHVAARDSMGIDSVLVSISTERDGRRWSTQVRMQRLAFSSFAQFVNRWDPSVSIHDDEIDGRFHSNSDIFVSRSWGVQPTFRGKVTTARRVNTSNSERFLRRDEVFLGGLETRVQRIELPQQFAALDDLGDTPPERVHRFAADASIEFSDDGSFSWAYLKAESPAQRVPLSDEPHYLLGGEDVSLSVSGIVNGKLLAYAPDDIVIVDDLVYADHPRVDPESDDFVGLVADRNVIIAESRLSGPGDLTVHAAIFAKRRFLVRHYRSGGGNTLHVFGSLAVGSLSATEPRFRTRLEFDPRLSEARPPGFPVTDRYEVIEWDGAWTEELPAEGQEPG